MSWSTAHAQIVSIVSSTVPASQSLGLGAQFKHQESNRPSAPRNFRLRVTGGESYIPGAAPCKRAYADVELTVSYDEVTRAEELNIVQVQDYEVLAQALGDQTQWNRPTSGIHSIDNTGSDSNFSYEIDKDGLKISFSVLYERG